MRFECARLVPPDMHNAGYKLTRCHRRTYRLAARLINLQRGKIQGAPQAAPVTTQPTNTWSTAFGVSLSGLYHEHGR